MPSAVTYQCPNCSAGLIFNPEKDLFCCEFCLSEFTEADLKKTEAGTKLKEEHEHAESEAFCEGMKQETPLLWRLRTNLRFVSDMKIKRRKS